MKVEDTQPFLVQCFCNKTAYLPKRRVSPCRNHTISSVRNATTPTTFIVMAKIQVVIKSIFAGSATINLPRSAARREAGKLMDENIRRVPCAQKLASCITITRIIRTIAAVTRNVTIRSFRGNQQQSRRHPCPLCLVNIILRECDILFTSSSLPCLCFISVKTRFAISVSFCAPLLTLRYLTRRSAIGAQNSRLFSTI